MKTKYLFRILLALIVSVFAASFLLPAENGGYVMTSMRVACGVAIVVTIVLHRAVIKHLESITNGFNLLKAQDFGSRLAHVGQYDTDVVIDMFNLIRSSLKEQRLHLREQNHFLDLLTNVSPMGIILLQTDRIISINPVGAAFLGFSTMEEALKVNLENIDTPLGRVLASLSSGEVRTVRLSDSMIFRCSRLSFMDDGFEHPFLLIEKLTEEVMKAETKSSGKVIRVIAHEVNNTIAGLDSLLAAIEMDNAAPSLDKSERDEVVATCRSRCRSLGKFISTFVEAVRIPDPVVSTRDLNECLRQWVIGLESLCRPRNITLRLELCESPLWLDFDSVLLEQVIINIVKNSAESISKDGEIIISTSDEEAGFTVIDNGRGISKECGEMLFSPFFTTKEEGHGIGLLFISEVLHKHGCRFSLTTDSDSLTRFKVYFPRDISNS